MGIVCCSYRYKLEQHHIVTVITEGTRAKAFLSLATQSEVRPLLKYLICFDATKFVLLSVSTAIETVCPKIRAKALPRNSTILFPVDLWRSKTFLLKLAIIATLPLHSKFLRLEVPHPFVVSVPYTLEWQNLFPFAQNCDKVHFVELRNVGALDGLFFVFLFSQTALVSHSAV